MNRQHRTEARTRREEDVRARRGLGEVVLDPRDDSDDDARLGRLAFAAAHQDGPADRIPIREQPARERPIDDDRGRARIEILLGPRELASAEQAHGQRGEVVGGHEVDIGARRLVGGGDPDRATFLEFAVRHDRGEARACHARCRADALDGLAVEALRLRRVEPGHAGIERQNQLVVGRETRVDPSRVEGAAHEEAAGGDERHRHRQLPDHEERSGSETPRRPARRARLAFEVGDQGRTRDRPRRSEREACRAEHRERGRRRQKARRGLDDNGDAERHGARHPGAERDARPPAEQQPRRRSAGRKDEALDEQLPHDPEPAAAERLTDCDLPPARHSPREQQVREIQTRHGEDERRHQRQQPSHDLERSARLWPRAHRHPRERADEERPLPVGLRVFGAEVRAQGVQRPIGGGAAHAGLEHAREVQRVVAAIGEAGGPLPERLIDEHVEVAERKPPFRRQQRHRPGEAARGDADDRERAAVDPNGAPDEAPVESRTPPRRIGGNRHGRVHPRALLGRGERPPGRQPDAERPEIVRRHERDERLPRRLSVPDSDGRERVGHQALEHTA